MTKILIQLYKKRIITIFKVKTQKLKNNKKIINRFKIQRITQSKELKGL